MSSRVIVAAKPIAVPLRSASSSAPVVSSCASQGHGPRGGGCASSPASLAYQIS